ncbi:MAG: VCBS repeat-containing protein [Nitrospirota bacterium]
MKRILPVLQSFIISLCCAFPSYADDNPLQPLLDQTLSYFKAVSGRVTHVEDGKAVINLGSKDGMKRGMRLTVLREQTPFRHPVTKEVLGNLESLAGKMEIREVSDDTATGNMLEGSAREGDQARISATKVQVLFCQSNGVDWQIADSYHKNLKDTGRFNLLDTSLETEDAAKALEEAVKLQAEVALLISAKADEKGTVITQRLYWVSDKVKLAEDNLSIDAASAKKLRFGDEFFRIGTESTLQFDLPLSARFIAAGDVDGDGKDEIVLGTEKDVGIYAPGADLQPALGGVRIQGEGGNENIWLDAVDLNGNGRVEIIVTAKKSNTLTSYIYELQGSGFVLLHKDSIFLRRLDGRLIAQAYSPAEGYSGSVYEMVWQGAYKKAEALQLPKGVNIYDFIFYDNAQTGKLVVAHDEDGFLNVYDAKGLRLWRSKGTNGGFLTTFAKSSPTSIVDRGEWTVKDKLILRNGGILTVQRSPLLEMVKGLGFKHSRIRQMKWNGMSMDETSLTDAVSGALLDYTVSGDRVLVLSSPLFGMRAGNIVKGENPFGTVLSVFPIKRM